MAKSINKVVEKKAFDELQSLLTTLVSVRESFTQTSEEARKFASGLRLPATSNDDLNKKLKESNDLLKKLQAEYKAQESTIQSLQSKIDGLRQARAAGNKQSALEAINQRELRKAADGEAVAQSNLTTFIQKLSVERMKHSKVVADLNAKLQMGINLSEQEQKQLMESTAAFTKYDAAIKAGKQSIGDMREYVGQYERANWGLNNSINQITRELPAFTYNAQTGFLAISNNIPMLVDEINKLKDGNKALMAQGKPQKNILMEVAGAFFSWNTVISAAITLTTVYGKEIGAAIKNLFGFKDALDSASMSMDNLNKAQERYNETRVKVSTSAEEARRKMERLIAVMKDETKTEDERRTSKEELIQLYPGYLKHLSDEEMYLSSNINNTDRYVAAMKRLREDINKRILAEEKLKQAQQTFSESQEIFQEVEKREKFNKEYLEKYREFGEGNEKYTQNERKLMLERVQIRAKELNDNADFVSKFGKIALPEKGVPVSEAGIYSSAQINQLSMVGFKLLNEYEEQLKEAERLMIETSLMDVKFSDANKRNAHERFISERDYYKSIYDLERRKLEIQIEGSEEIMNNEAENIEKRFEMSEGYAEASIKLAELTQKEELRLLDFEVKEEQRKLKHLLDQGKISNEKYSRDLISIDEDQKRKRKIIEINYWDEVNKANVNAFKAIKELWREFNLEDSLLGIDKDELQALNETVAELQRIDLGELRPTNASINAFTYVFEKIDAEERKFQNQIKQTRLEAHEHDLRLKLAELKATGENSVEYIQLERELTANLKEQAELRKEIRNEEVNVSLDLARKEHEERQRLMRELFQSAIDFTNQLLQNNVQRWETEIQKNNEYYDALISNAEKGSEQELALQEEKEAAEEHLRRKKIDAEIRVAMFNKLAAIAEIAVTTIKAVAAIKAQIAILSATPATKMFVPGAVAQIPFVLGSAALQTAAVMASPLPQYKHGRLGGPAEDAIVGDGYVHEVIENPRTGKIQITPDTPTVMHLEKDDIVHSSIEKWQKNRIKKQSNQMFDSLQNQYYYIKEFDLLLKNEFTGISEKIEKGIERGFKKARTNINVAPAKIDLNFQYYRRKGLTS